MANRLLINLLAIFYDNIFAVCFRYQQLFEVKMTK